MQTNSNRTTRNFTIRDAHSSIRHYTHKPGHLEGEVHSYSSPNAQITCRANCGHDACSSQATAGKSVNPVNHTGSLENEDNDQAKVFAHCRISFFSRSRSSCSTFNHSFRCTSPSHSEDQALPTQTKHACSPLQVGAESNTAPARNIDDDWGT